MVSGRLLEAHAGPRVRLGNRSHSTEGKDSHCRNGQGNSPRPRGLLATSGHQRLLLGHWIGLTKSQGRKVPQVD